MTSAAAAASAPSPTDGAPHKGGGAGAGGNIYIAFVPWVLFSVIARHESLTAATIVALLAAIAIAAPGIAARRPKLLELGAVAAFVVFTVVALIADPAAGSVLERYARAFAAGALALIAFGSLAFVPFTEQYARESVPQEHWSSPRFKQVNRELTLMWACVFAAMVPCHIVAGAIDTPRAETIFNWVIPVGLIVLAVKQTGKRTEE